MAKEAKKDTATDILEEVRAVDKMVKRALLLKVLSHLKHISRKILRYRELVKAELKEMGISDADAKRIIDFINESSDVKLTEDDLKAVLRDAHASIKEKKKEIEKGMEKNDIPFSPVQYIPGAMRPGMVTGDSTVYNQSDNIYYATSSTGDTVIKDSNGGEISVKL